MNQTRAVDPDRRLPGNARPMAAVSTTATTKTAADQVMNKRM